MINFLEGNAGLHMHFSDLVVSKVFLKEKMIKDLYADYIKNSSSSITINKHSINKFFKKQSKELNTNSSQKKIYEEPVRHMIKYSTSLVIREI